MRKQIIGLGLILMTAVPANAATLVGSTVSLEYLFPDSATVFGSSNLFVASDPTTLSCSPGGAGVCSAFAENATFTVTADSITLNEAAGSGYTSATFNGLQYANLDFGPGFKLGGFSLSTN